MKQNATSRALLLVVLSCATWIEATDSKGALDVKDFLSAEGLACCTDVIVRRSGWWQRGAAVDMISDLRFLTEAQIATLPMPTVKRNILSALASKERQRSFEREGWLKGFLASLLAALEVAMRGFMFGSGFSFIYETMFFSKDFYAASEDLVPRVKRAAFRAAAVGFATAAAMHGMSMFVPHFLRSQWLAGIPVEV